MKIRILFFIMLPVLTAGSLVRAQVRVRTEIFEGSIPAYRWTKNFPQGDTSALFMPVAEDFGKVPLTFLPDSVHLICPFHFRIEAYRERTWSKKKPEVFSGLDSVFFPPLFGCYLYRDQGKYGLMTEEGAGVAPPVFDSIWVLYQYAASMGKKWVLSPVFMVYRNRQYALMDANGFIVTRYCKDPALLPESYLITGSDQFSLDQRIPFEYWGY